MAPAEALATSSVNVAFLLDCADRKGRLAAGYNADIVLLDVPDWRYIAYNLASEIVNTVVPRGRVAYARRALEPPAERGGIADRST